MVALARTLALATAVTLSTVACSRRDLPDDPVGAPLATGIPNGAAGAVGASFEPPPAGALAAPAPPRKAGPSKTKPHPPVPPPDPFGSEGDDDDGEGGSAPAPPAKPPPPKGVAL